MLEVVFGMSAKGSLKVAQHYGEGPYRRGHHGAVFLATEGEEKPDPQVLKEAERTYEERECCAWEQATPLGGEPSDVFGFPLGLSVGAITGTGMDEIREQALKMFFEEEKEVQELVQQAREDIETLRRRMEEGEPVRIWYSDQADERCGLVWLLAQMDAWELKVPEIQLIKLPDWMQKDNYIVEYQGVGEVTPGEWSRFLPFQRKASSGLLRAASLKWRMLQKENAPLRAVVAGKILSVDADFYDWLIRKELENQETEFQEPQLIGSVIRHQVGVWDTWIALRVEEMIRAGELEVVTQESADAFPNYRKILRKCRNSR